MDTQENVLATDVFPNNKVYTLDELMTSVILPLKTASWNKLYRRSFIGNCKFPDGRIHGEDLVFILNVLKYDTKFCTTDYVGYNYFKRRGTITTGKFNSRSFDEVWCKDEAFATVKMKFPEYTIQFKSLLFRARLNLLRKMTKAKSTNLVQYKEYTEWLIKERCSFQLSFKDNIEYLLLVYFNSLYTIIFSR